jgi:hypothetical protein
MKYKTLFRLLLKAIGVFLFMQGIAHAITQLGWVLQILGVSLFGGFPGSWDWGLVGYLLGSVVQAILGLYLFFGGAWIADKAIPGNRPYCPECAYDLTRIAGDRCPECGTPLAGVAPVENTQA